MNPLFQLALRSVTPKETALPYQLGGNSDPHFQGNGSKPFTFENVSALAGLPVKPETHVEKFDREVGLDQESAASWEEEQADGADRDNDADISEIEGERPSYR